MLVFKARPRRDPAQRVDLTESQKRIMRLLNTAMNEVRRDVIRDEGKLLDGLEHLSLDRIVNMVTDEPWLEMQQALQEELLGELNDAGKRVKLPAIQKATIVYSFDATRPEAAAWAQLEAGKMVSQVIESQRDVVRYYASRASMGEFTPRQVARGLRDVVGLTTQQSGWVQNFRDNEIGRQMATGKDFDQAYAASEKATDRYHNKIHKYRTETIARTETLRASNEGRNLAWQQGLDEGFINPNASKMWSAELDGRVCDLCAPLDGVIVPIKGSFSAGDPPRHPNCRCTVLLTDAIPTDIASMTDAELDAEIDSLIGMGNADVLRAQNVPGQPEFDDDFANSSRNFLGTDAGPEWGNTESARWQAMVESDEPTKSAIRAYTRSGYQDANRTLRDGIYDPINPTTVDDAITLIGRALERGSTTEAVIGVRGVGIQGGTPELLAFRDKINNLKPGDVFHEPGFTSVSLSHSSALQGDVSFRIKLPAGTKGGYLGRLSEYRDQEQEFLVQAGSTYKVTKVTVQNGRTFVDTELVHQKFGSYDPPEYLQKSVRYNWFMEKKEETETTKLPPPFSGDKFVWQAGDITIIKAPKK